MNILSRLRAEYIRAGMASLPDVRTAKEKYVVSEADIPGFGTVIFLFKQFRYRHGKSDHWFWSVQNAILKEDLLRFGSDAASAE